MSTLFKIIGLLVAALGVLDLGLMSYRISLWRILDVTPPSVMGDYTYLYLISYGALTIFVANYLKKPVEEHLEIVDLSDPFIGADAHYVARPKPKPELKIELFAILKGLLLGSGLAAFLVLLFPVVMPGMEGVFAGLADPAQTVAPKTRKLLVVAASLCVALPVITAYVLFRLRDPLAVAAIFASFLVTAALLVVAVLQTPGFGAAAYGAERMAQIHAGLGYPEGLPEGWSIEGEALMRLRVIGRF